MKTKEAKAKRDNLDVETMAHSFAIDEHLEFHQDIEGTKAMFAREHRSRELPTPFCCLDELSHFVFLLAKNCVF